MKDSYRFFENKECKYYPCHKKVVNKLTKEYNFGD